MRKTAKSYPAFVFVFLFLVSGGLFAQENGNKTSISPKYNDGEKWVVSYQSQISCRFQILSGGNVTTQKRVKKIATKKYVKNFKRVTNGRPVDIIHHYIISRYQKQTGEGSDIKDITGPLNGKHVNFEWDGSKGMYNVSKVDQNSEIPKSSLENLSATEMYEYLLPGPEVDIQSETWEPNIKNPAVFLFGVGSKKKDTSIIPGVETFECSLNKIQQQAGKDYAVINLTLKIQDQSNSNDEEDPSTIEGKLKYNLTEQKPVSLEMQTAPPGISFRKKVDGNVFHIKNMVLSLSVQYDTDQPK